MKAKHCSLVTSREGQIGSLIKQADNFVKETKGANLTGRTQIYKLNRAVHLYREALLIMNDDVIQYQRAIWVLERQIDEFKEANDALGEQGA